MFCCLSQFIQRLQSYPLTVPNCRWFQTCSCKDKIMMYVVCQYDTDASASICRKWKLRRGVQDTQEKYIHSQILKLVKMWFRTHLAWLCLVKPLMLRLPCMLWVHGLLIKLYMFFWLCEPCMKWWFTCVASHMQCSGWQLNSTKRHYSLQLCIFPFYKPSLCII